ncbi:MAG: sigma-54-dependent Fis family transcriptional regulator, partial [Opitutales bacterium]|nr:sigma-54-dependent Fis family transcriptional regulator [Opitutales bacterium]
MLQKLVKERKAKATRLSEEAMATLSRYSWPGNVRELGNVVYHSAVVAQGGVILVKDLPDTLLTGGVIQPVATQGSIGLVNPENVVIRDLDLPSPVDPVSTGPQSLADTFDFVYEEVKAREGKRILTFIEKQMIQRAIADTGGNQARAAEILGITRNTLRKRLDEYASDV